MYRTYRTYIYMYIYHHMYTSVQQCFNVKILLQQQQQWLRLLLFTKYSLRMYVILLYVSYVPGRVRPAFGLLPGRCVSSVQRMYLFSALFEEMRPRQWRYLYRLGWTRLHLLLLCLYGLNRMECIYRHAIVIRQYLRNNGTTCYPVSY